jgi:hypothetical protein
VIYTGKLDDGSESLHVMDSSGATRSYGEPAARVHAYGWLPDANRFVYGVGDPASTFIGKVDGPPAFNETDFTGPVHWLENENYLDLREGRLVLGDFEGTVMTIEVGVTNFDVIRSK